MSKEAKFFEDYVIGESYMTPARTITETDIITHAMHSGDWQPHHTDLEFAKTQPFKKPIAHGNCTFVISTGLIFRAEGKPNPNVMAYGYNKIRYPHPVFAGDTIKTEVKIAAKNDAKQPTHGLLTQTETTTNQRGEVVAFVEHILYATRRNPK